MRITGEKDSVELDLSDGDEVSTLRAAAAIWANGIPWFDVVHRPLRKKLWTLAGRMAHEESAFNGESEPGPVHLSRLETELGVRAMRWVVTNDDFAPEYTTGDIRHLLMEVESADTAA